MQISTRMKILVIGFLILIGFKQAQAQWSLAAGLGGTSYSGDVADPLPRDSRPAFNMEAWYRVSKGFYLKGGVSAFQLYARDIYDSRNRTFKADLYDVYAGFVTAYPGRKLMPFFSGGIGIAKVEPANKVWKANNQSWWFNTSKWLPDGEAIPSHTMIIPLTVGLRYRMSPRWGIILDAGVRLTDTDMLDGVSKEFIIVDELTDEGRAYYRAINPEGLESGKIANGNPDKKDVYGMFTIKLQYIFGAKQKNHLNEYHEYIFSDKRNGFSIPVYCPY